MKSKLGWIVAAILAVMLLAVILAPLAFGRMPGNIYGNRFTQPNAPAAGAFQAPGDQGMQPGNGQWNGSGRQHGYNQPGANAQQPWGNQQGGNNPPSGGNQQPGPNPQGGNNPSGDNNGWYGCNPQGGRGEMRGYNPQGGADNRRGGFPPAAGNGQPRGYNPRGEFNQPRGRFGEQPGYPMQSYRAEGARRFGLFGLLFVGLACLVMLGLLALAVVGVVALIRHWTQRRRSVAPVVDAALGDTEAAPLQENAPDQPAADAAAAPVEAENAAPVGSAPAEEGETTPPPDEA